VPRRLIDAMREAVTGADLDELLSTIQEVQTSDPRLARRLRRLAEQFEYQTLLDSFGPGEPGVSSSSCGSRQ
jgi:hypothetical protein